MKTSLKKRNYGYLFLRLISHDYALPTLDRELAILAKAIRNSCKEIERANTSSEDSKQNKSVNLPLCIFCLEPF